MIFFRSFLFNIYFYTLTVIMTVTLLPMLLMPRDWCIRLVSLWGRLVLGGLKLICGITFEIRGFELLPNHAILIASKHQSLWETILYPTLLYNPAVVLKRELFWIPLYGWFATKTKMISVNRSAHAKALRSMIAQAKDRLEHNRSIIIFPEGTRRAPQGTPDYKPGVAALYGMLKTSCVPVALNSGHFWPRRKFLRYPGTIILEFLEPIPPGLKRKEFMVELEKRIEQATATLAPKSAT